MWVVRDYVCWNIFGILVLPNCVLFRGLRDLDDSSERKRVGELAFVFTGVANTGVFVVEYCAGIGFSLTQCSLAFRLCRIVAGLIFR